MKVRKYAKKGVWISLLMVIPDHIKDCKDNMKGVETVQGNKKIVEADLFLLDQNNDWQGVTDDAESTKYEHAITNEVGIVLEPIALIDYSHVLLRIVATISIVRDCKGGV